MVPGTYVNVDGWPFYWFFISPTKNKNGIWICYPKRKWFPSDGHAADERILFFFFAFFVFLFFVFFLLVGWLFLVFGCTSVSVPSRYLALAFALPLLVPVSAFRRLRPSRRDGDAGGVRGEVLHGHGEHRGREGCMVARNTAVHEGLVHQRRDAGEDVREPGGSMGERDGGWGCLWYTGVGGAVLSHGVLLAGFGFAWLALAGCEFWCICIWLVCQWGGVCDDGAFVADGIVDADGDNVTLVLNFPVRFLPYCSYGPSPS